MLKRGINLQIQLIQPTELFLNLSILLAVATIMLVIIVELSSPHDGLKNLTISYRKLKNAAIVTSVLFSITLLLQIVGLIL